MLTLTEYPADIPAEAPPIVMALPEHALSVLVLAKKRRELLFLRIYGKVLKETLQAIAQQSKEFTCWLIVDATNIHAQKLYEKLGFRRWVETSADITPFPGYIMGLSHRRYRIDTKPLLSLHSIHTHTIHVC